jgi:chaperonin GroES
MIQNSPAQEQMPQQDTESPEEVAALQEKSQLDRYLAGVNIAKELDNDELKKIGIDVLNGFDKDKASRNHWEQQYEEWIKLALQVKEVKMFPWPNASNVKFPLVSTASMQFAARAYPTLIPSDGRIVKSTVIGADPDGEKQKRAERVSKYMSYQVLHEMDNWEEDMDRLLFMLPIIGTVFKKTYWDDFEKKTASVLVNPQNLVVNYWTRDLDKCERVTEVIFKSKREIEEGKRMEIYRDVDLPNPQIPDTKPTETKMQEMPDLDDTTPYMLLEQHCYLDLDKDGYSEPYVVLVEKNSKEVLRITPRFAKDSVKTEGKKIVKITPLNFYTKYEFIPNPDGGFYSIGFGFLLGPLNDSVNTLINQLVDAGTINNLPSGFIGKGLRLKMGDMTFKPGEWKPVNSIGSELKQQIVPIPAKEPSTVLFQLLNLLIQSTKELASVAEIFTGKMPGQNTPATTTMATVEQGMKVFTAIYKRVYRSLSKEFKKLYRLNFLYVDPNTEKAVLDEPVGPEDFNAERYDICPAADPNASSQQEKLMKAQGLMELMPLGTLNPQEVTLRILTAQEQPFIEKLMNQGPPPPDPKMQEMEMKMQAEQQASQVRVQEMQRKGELETQSKQTQLHMKEQEHAINMQAKVKEAQLKSVAALHNQKIFMAQAADKLKAQQVGHVQKIQHTQEMNKLQKSNSTTGQTNQKPKNSSR